MKELIQNIDMDSAQCGYEDITISSTNAVQLYLRLAYQDHIKAGQAKQLIHTRGYVD